MTTAIVVRSNDNSITVLEAIHASLETITTVEDAKAVADQADALLYLVKKAKLGLGAQNHCAFIRLSALRRAGELIEQMEKHKGRPAKASQLKRLSEHGIDYNTSYRWRALARLPADSLERLWREHDKQDAELTTAAAMRVVRSLIGQTDYDTIMTPYHVKLKEYQRRASSRMIADVAKFTNRFRARGPFTAAMNEILAWGDDDFDHRERAAGAPQDTREAIERHLNAFIACRNRLDRCIEVLERTLNKEPVAWGYESTSLLDYLSP